MKRVIGRNDRMSMSINPIIRVILWYPPFRPFSPLPNPGGEEGG